jgi:Tfp pilus assembly protein PilX
MFGRIRLKPRRGIALVVVILVVMAVAAIASGATFLGLSTTLISKYHTRLSVLESAADAGLEQARSAMNAIDSLYPDSGYVVYENGVAVTDAGGVAVPGVRRWTYVGPTGISTGQYGIFGSVVTVVTDQTGNRIVRRLEVMQESFAKYSYFTDVEGNIVFGANDVIYGPVHTNDTVRIQNANPGATFWGRLKTAKTIINRPEGNYNAGYEENAAEIPFPETSDLTKLLAQATIGGTNFTSSTAGGPGQATMRIEFVALDLNGDGDSTDVDEGFMKIYSVTNTSNAWFVVADTTGNFNSNGLRASRNCAHRRPTGGSVQHSHIKTFFRHAAGTSSSSDQRNWAVGGGPASSRLCYLGGADELNDNVNTVANPYNTFRVDDGAVTAGTDDHGMGAWIAWTGAVDARVTAVRPRDAAFLWPVSRTLNPNFKGVIHVTGKVAISGKLRGKITLAATGNIIIADNITYVTNAGGTVPCNSATRDMLGIFSGGSVVVANNLLNAPWGTGPGVSGIVVSGTHRTWAARGAHEYIHGVVLALSQFTANEYNRGPTNVEDCQGADNARGCLYLTGGIIQNSRGPVGITDGRGYTKRYQYDACAGSEPPPYFPTTGHFVRGHYYEVEPTNFDIDTFWSLLIPTP